jgi:CRP-like cAMP-binding protein
LQLDPSAFIADQELIQALQTYAMKVSCGGDCILFRQGDAPAGLYIINKGEVILTMSSLAGESVLSIQVPPGSVLGLPGLIGNEPYTMTAIANCGAEISFVPRNDVLALMQTNPILSLKLLPVLAAEVRSARQAMLEP